MVTIGSGTVLLGSDDGLGPPGDGEGPVRAVAISAFDIDSCAVTNAEFAAFVAATGYVTQAEAFGWSFVFRGLATADAMREATGSVAVAPWWLAVPGADWRHPDGAGSGIDDRLDHPVVHVSWHDAMAFCAWAGTRLPREAEWECAARGGLVQARHPWGDDLLADGEWRCNIWQGEFPVANSRDDGFVGTAPVRSYPPNGFGLFEMTGNVWEWCADWYSTDRGGAEPTAEPIADPTGPASGTARVIRGGSYLCHDSYCNRYRVAARNSSTPDSSAGNVGFRCAR